MSQASEYAAAVNRIQQQKADAIAQGHLRSGQIWGQTVATLGQVVPQQIQEVMRKQAEKRKTEQLQAIFQKHGGDLPSAISEVMAIDPDLGLDLTKRYQDAATAAFNYRSAQWKAKKDEIETIGNLIGSAKDQDSYVQALVTAKMMGLDVSKIPAEYSPAVVEQYNRALLTAKERLELERPKEPGPLVPIPGPDGTTVYGTREQAIGKAVPADPTTTGPLVPVMGPDGKPIYSTREQAVGQAVPQSATTGGVNVGSFEDYVIRYAQGLGKSVEQLSAADIEAARKRYQQADDRPIHVSTGDNSTMWAKDPNTNEVRLMTKAEIMRIGATQPDTADMRNKQYAKATSGRGIEAVKELGTKIFTKVGPAQRALAIKRGAQAVFGNDPEFRTYQDSRMALAGALAVEQQGSRVSDADVKALWLPMVPDAYSDTRDSYKLKWDLIDAMRGVQPAKTAPAPSAASKKANPFRK